MATARKAPRSPRTARRPGMDNQASRTSEAPQTPLEAPERASGAGASASCFKQEGSRGFVPISDTETARARGRAGGLASAAARRKRKEVRMYLDVALKMDDEETGELNAMAMALAMVREAKHGNVRAFLAILEALGEKATVLDHRSTDGSMSPCRGDLTALSFAELMALTGAEWAGDDAELVDASGGETVQ